MILSIDDLKTNNNSYYLWSIHTTLLRRLSLFLLDV